VRVDTTQVPAQGGFKIRNGTGAFTATLKEGDRITAEVQSADKGAVVMKAEGGQVFRAKLDADVALFPGDKVLLEYAGKEAGLVILSIRDDNAAAGQATDEAAAQSLAARDFEDKTLSPYAGKLASLNMPVSEETARIMRQLIAQYPGMTLDEAAFLASNKLTGDESLINAALAVLSDGAKTDEMIKELLALLLQAGITEAPDIPSSYPEFIGPGEPALTTPPTPEAPVVAVNPDVPEAPAAASNPDAPLVPAAPVAPEQPLAVPEQPLPALAQTTILTSLAEPLTALLARFGNSETSLINASVQDETVPARTAQMIIPHNTNILQSTNVENIEDFLHFIDISAQEAVISGLPAPQNPATDTVFMQNPDAQTTDMPLPFLQETEIDAPPPLPAEANPEVMISAFPPTGDQEIPVTNIQTSAPAGAPGGETRIPDQASAVLAEILSEIPEFRDTPAPALERFSNMLLRAAGDITAASGSETEKLADLIEKLFTRVDKNDADAGIRLRNAREEIYARLALIEETISRAAPSAREEMIGQTRKLMDHVRLLNNIDQFVYMQLPVEIGGDRRTAELYLFKKKGGKKLDPENTNILLALDLENMGRWEGLINFRNRDVSIRMEVQGAGEKDHISENTVLLHELLAEAGFKLVSTNITYATSETTPLTALTALDRYALSRVGAIDFLV